MTLLEAVQAAADRHRPYIPPAVGLAEFVEATSNYKLHPWQLILCNILERLKTEKGLRLLIHGPPQYGKSLIVSQRLLPWLLGHDPSLKCVLSCYNLETAEGFTKVARGIMGSSEYAEMFPDNRARISPGSGAGGRFNTVARDHFSEASNSVRAVGLNSGLTGTGPDIFIADDPYGSFADAVSEAINRQLYDFFWDKTAKPRISQDANALFMFHRYQPLDIAGRLLEEGGWEYIRFPAVADANVDGSDPTGRQEGELLSPLRTQEWLDTIRDNDPLSWWGLFQGLPRNPEGNLFKVGDFQVIDECDVPKLTRLYRSWDIASGTKTQNDWSAGAKIGMDDQRNLYIFDVQRHKLQYPDLRAHVMEVARMDGVNTPIGVEAKVAGLALIPDLQKELAGSYAVYGLQVSTDKYTNALTWAAIGRARRLYLVRGPWNQPFINECLGFTGQDGQVDDQVDAVSRAVQLVAYIGGQVESEKEPPAYGSREYYDQLRQQYSRPTGDSD